MMWQSLVSSIASSSPSLSVVLFGASIISEVELDWNVVDVE
jgi:hypothetical protein